MTLFMPFAISGKSVRDPETFEFSTKEDDKTYQEGEIFSIMTLNIGHGRGREISQFFQGRNKILENADNIAKIINKYKIDVSLLQEVDGPALWNKGFSFIEYLGKRSGYVNGLWSKNVDTAGVKYGTAILSDFSYVNADSHTFKARPFILPKGFTMGSFSPSKEKSAGICVVSVHLAPLFPFIRKLQAEAIIDKVKNINEPVIIAGDFNCGYKKKSALRFLAESLNLKTIKPGAKDMGTFHSGKRRLDWILISEELEFIEYSTIKERVSDHLAVRAVIKY